MISVFIITQNEEENIGDCVRALSFADEIVVVDALSTDRTVEIARQLGARVYLRSWSGYTEQRNYAIEQCRGDWLVYMDADERPGEGFGDEVRALLTAGDKAADEAADAYWVSSREFFMGRFLRFGGYGLNQSNRKIRVWRRGSVRFVGEIHERAFTVGKTSTFRSYIDHYSRAATVSGLVDQCNRYSDIESLSDLRNGVNPSIRRLLWRPLKAFVSRFIVHQGCRDGLRGLIVAALRAHYFFLVEAKLLQAARSPRSTS